jgi:hypothetical protein
MGKGLGELTHAVSSDLLAVLIVGATADLGVVDETGSSSSWRGSFFSLALCSPKAQRAGDGGGATTRVGDGGGELEWSFDWNGDGRRCNSFQCLR